MEDEVNINILDDDNININLQNEETINAQVQEYRIENNYNYLQNKPQINSVELIGNKTTSDLNLQEPIDLATNTDIDNMFR